VFEAIISIIDDGARCLIHLFRSLISASSIDLIHFSFFAVLQKVSFFSIKCDISYVGEFWVTDGWLLARCHVLVLQLPCVRSVVVK
jgi:hypothetical protein